MGFFVIMCHSVFNAWPKTTLLPVWPRDAESLDTPGEGPAAERMQGRQLSCNDRSSDGLESTERE